MKYFFTLLLYFFSLSCVVATGFPEIKIKLIPLAVNQQGYVLFATKSLKNPMGSNRIYRYDFGWLVVNKEGVWDEREAFHSSLSEEKDGFKYKQYDAGEINLQQPDKTLKELMEKYHFKADNKLKKESWVLAIKPHQTCFKGKCIERSLKQKTLGEVASTIVHTPIRSNFYYKGVALFHNIYETGRIDEVEKKEQGSSFDFEQEQIVFEGEKYPRRHPHSYIDGLILFDPDLKENNGLSNIYEHFTACRSSADKKTYTVKNVHWELCQSSEKVRIIHIAYSKKDTEYMELYYVENGKLTHAIESESGMNDGYWDVKYQIKDEKQVRIVSSLGHGKTEDDNWKPESILGMYKKRMQELNKIKNKK
ncbi:MAG: hypothetical protein L3J51_13105 [Cocleimonas sp.]|nr:hypothetical protein [Cocleimonas sp.]